MFNDWRTMTERLECTEPFCIAAFRREELIAHLQMDHGYNERKAKARVEWEHE